MGRPLGALGVAEARMRCFPEGLAVKLEVAVAARPLEAAAGVDWAEVAGPRAAGC